MRARRRRLKRNRLAAVKPPEFPICKLLLISPEEVEELWILGEDFLRSAERYGEYAATDLYEWVASGYAQLWLAWSDKCEAAAVTRIIDTPQGRFCLIAALGGKIMSHWVGLKYGLELWAKQEGCIGMRLYGRYGWLRKLPDYALTRVILDKRLT